MRGFGIAALVAVGCNAGGDVEIVDVRVESTIEETRVEIDAANVGRRAAWIHTAPWTVELVGDGEEIILGFRGDDTPPEERPLHSFTPVINYKRLARRDAQLFDNTHTIEVTLANELGPVDQRVFVPDIPAVTVEVEWYDDDPGDSVAFSAAPAPTGVAAYTRTIDR